MMEFLHTLQPYFQNPFVLGLLLGLLFAIFIWKSGYTAKRHLLRELKRTQVDLRELQGHLNTQLKINASGNEILKSELETVRRHNETLRVNIASLQQKPGRAEQRLLQIHEAAVRTMREQAPGFAPAWEKALRQAESEIEEADSGLRRLVRRVIPALGNSAAASSQTGTAFTEAHD